MAGKVVRAVAGRRSTYRPIESGLAKGPSPEAIGKAFAELLDVRHVYVADLDAIEGAQPCWEVYVQLLQAGLSLWIDAGIRDVARAERLVEFAQDHLQVEGIIGGLESLPDRETLQQCLEVVGDKHFIFGLDLRDGRPVTSVDQWSNSIAAEVAADVIASGVGQLLLVDLACVGMHGGCTAERLCHRIHRQHPDVGLSAGGGVRDIEDLRSLKQCGCRSAVVGSALHDGWITAEDVQALGDDAPGDDAAGDDAAGDEAPSDEA